ncbi:hypothetical protein ACIGEZ_27560 [Streptomyces sp. NPDC085481]|uniref:hypothetical protein n=1 Tax=Streptomyces sp. NPDC085481 TaxID=3365727 RepID=UPI0037CF16D1
MKTERSGRSLWRDRDRYGVVREGGFPSLERAFGSRSPRNESRTAEPLVEAAG